MRRRDDLPVKPHRGHLLDARLHLLDRQLLDAEGDPVGIVDDLELDGVEPDRDIDANAPAPQVSALLSGQVLARSMSLRRTAFHCARLMANSSMVSGRSRRCCRKDAVWV